MRRGRRRHTASVPNLLDGGRLDDLSRGRPFARCGETNQVPNGLERQLARRLARQVWMEVGCADRHSYQCIAAEHDDGMPVRRRPSDRCQDELTPEQGVSGIGYRYSFRLLWQQSVRGIALCGRMPATRMATALAMCTSTP